MQFYQTFTHCFRGDIYPFWMQWYVYAELVSGAAGTELVQ